MRISEERIKGLAENWERNYQQEKQVPLYQMVYSFLKESIRNQDLPSGCELPATRRLAVELNMSRSTIVKVYELLRLDNLLVAKVGSGHIVNPNYLPHPKRKQISTDIKRPPLSALGASYLKNIGMVNSVDNKQVAFRPGLPPLDIFPITSWRRQANKYWQFTKASELTYYPESGVETLRRMIADYLNLTRNVKTDWNQIMIVGGSLQSLFLIGSLLLNPADSVLVENPTFPNVISLFKGLRANLHGVELDDGGMDVNSMVRKRLNKLKLIHVTPSCQYPLGLRMPVERRREVLEFARRKGAYIIENEYEHEINNYGTPGGSIYALDQEDRTFYLGTFNRIMHPSIRVGFMVVPKHLVLPMQSLMRHSHMFVSPAIQFMLSSFIEGKFLQRHMLDMKPVIEERLTTFQTALKKIEKNKFQSIDFHSRSLHLTGILGRSISDMDVVSSLKKAGVIGHSLSKCYLGDARMQGIIFGHSCIRPQAMRVPLNSLIQVFKKQVR